MMENDTLDTPANLNALLKSYGKFSAESTQRLAAIIQAIAQLHNEANAVA